MPPVPSAPPSSPLQLTSLLRLRPAPGRRWPFAARAGLCMGAPVLTGWLAGDVTAGLMATIGAFTSLYGSDRPYLNRALHLAVIALAFALAVMAGVWATTVPVMVVPTIVVMAMIATFVCNALRIGPPGAYMFALACAAGTGMPISHLSVAQVGLLVFAGGAFAWLVHMTGALVWPRGPDRAAVVAAANALERFVQSIGTPNEDNARHGAALALHQAWTVLVTYQPARPRPNGTLSHLRALNRELNLRFAGLLNNPADSAAQTLTAERARQIAAQAKNAGGHAEHTDPAHVPLGHHGLWESLWENLRSWSPALMAAVRIGVATTIAGLIGQALGLERAYWTMAAAVLMLHQGLDWMRSLQRGIQRMIGTVIGLVLAGGILAVHPEGLWLVIVLVLLQFTIEMTVIRNYALAVIFITSAALLIASGGHMVPDVGHLLWVRASDTFIGCAIGLVTLALTSPRVVAVRIPQELINTLQALEKTVTHAARGDVTTTAARRARRDLQQRTITLLQAYDASVGATPRHRDAAERAWPTVVAAQRLAYRVLSVCWSLENAGAGANEMARSLFGPNGEPEIKHAVTTLSSAIRGHSKPAPLAHVPEFLSTEMHNLHDSLVYAGTDASPPRDASAQQPGSRGA